MKTSKPKNNRPKPLREPNGRFMKGTHGGPGKPPGTLDLVKIMKKELEAIDPESRKSYAQLLIRRIRDDAIKKGDSNQIKNLLQYIEGMPTQRVENTGTQQIELSILKDLDGRNSDIRKAKDEAEEL